MSDETKFERLLDDIEARNSWFGRALGWSMTGLVVFMAYCVFRMATAPVDPIYICLWGCR